MGYAICFILGFILGGTVVLVLMSCIYINRATKDLDIKP